MRHVTHEFGTPEQGDAPLHSVTPMFGEVAGGDLVPPSPTAGGVFSEADVAEHPQDLEILPAVTHTESVAATPSDDSLGGSLGAPNLSSTAIWEQVRLLILDGSLRPGARLSQVQLAAQLGVSRTPLREALRRLQAEGLITAERGRQVHVANIDVDELDAIYAARISLESLAAHIGVPRLDEADRDGLRSAFSRIENPVEDYSVWAVAHHEFHRLMTAHAGSAMCDLLSGLEHRSERYRRVLLYEVADQRRWDDSTHQHRMLLDACVAGNADEARRLVAHHLATQALDMMTSLEPAHEPIAVRAALRLTLNEPDGRSIKSRR